MIRSYLVCVMLVFAACGDDSKKSGASANTGAAPKAAEDFGDTSANAKSNPFAKSAKMVLEGRAIYLQTGCSGCHGMGGGGGMGKPVIDEEWTFGSDDKTLFKLIRGEIPNQTMPNAIGKTLTDEQVWKVLLYVRSVYTGDPAKISWEAPPPVPPEMLAAATQTTGDPIAAGKTLFSQICTPCHGEGGKGDGPAAAALDPKPKNLADAAYMGPLSNRYIFELVSRGGIAVGKSQLMPAQSNLTAAEINNIIAYVRTLSGTPDPQAADSTGPSGRSGAGH